MKKKLIYLFIGFVLILSIAYLLRYKLSDSFENKIPKGTTAILKVNIRQLEHHFLIDFFTNPTVYLKSSKTTKKDSIITKNKTPSIFKGIKIPKSILFYTNDSNHNKTWVSTKIKIKNTKILSSFLLSNGFEILQLKEVNSYNKKNIKVIIKKDELIIIVNPTINADNYHYLFTETTFLDNNSLILQKLNKSKSDVVYTSINNEILEANFNIGNIEINGTANFDFIKNTQQTIDTSTIGLIATTFNKENITLKKALKTINKDKFKSLTKLSFDSIYAKWNGAVYFNLNTFKIKTDTIKTYEYDDDFNKIEKIATQKTSNPDFTFRLGSNSDIYSYLDNAKTINIIENDTVFIPLPIIKTFVNITQNQTLFYTSKTENKPTRYVDNKLVVSLDFTEYRKNTINTAFYYFENLKSIQKCAISISKENEINVKIEMLNTNRNALVQFIN